MPFRNSNWRTPNVSYTPRLFYKRAECSSSNDYRRIYRRFSLMLYRLVDARVARMRSEMNNWSQREAKRQPNHQLSSASLWRVNGDRQGPTRPNPFGRRMKDSRGIKRRNDKCD